METLLTIALFASLITLIIGFTNPEKVLFGNLTPSRRNVLIIYGGLFTLFAAATSSAFLPNFLVFGTILGFIASIIEPEIFHPTWGQKILIPVWAGGLFLSLVILSVSGTQNTTEQSTFIPNSTNTEKTDTYVNIPNLIGLTVEEVHTKFSSWNVISVEGPTMKVVSFANNGTYSFTFAKDEGVAILISATKSFEVSRTAWEKTKESLIDHSPFDYSLHTPKKEGYRWTVGDLEFTMELIKNANLVSYTWAYTPEQLNFLGIQ